MDPPAVVSSFKTLCSGPDFKHISVGPLIKAFGSFETRGGSRWPAAATCHLRARFRSAGPELVVM